MVMEKIELAALILLAVVLAGTPLSVYAYQLSFTAELNEAIRSGGVREFPVDRDEWNVTKVEVMKGQVVRLVTYGSRNNGITVEEYLPKTQAYGPYVVQFLADKPGTFKIELAILERECHCWLTTPYQEVGVLVVKDNQ